MCNAIPARVSTLSQKENAESSQTWLFVIFNAEALLEPLRSGIFQKIAPAKLAGHSGTLLNFLIRQSQMRSANIARGLPT